MQTEEQEMQEKQEGLIFKERKIKSPLNKSVEFATEVHMLIKIVGFGDSQNVTIVTNLAMLRRIAKSRALNKLIFLRSKKVKGTCSMLVTRHRIKPRMYGFSIADVAIT